MNTPVYHSSESDTWLTPKTIADLLGPIAFDPCGHPKSLVRSELSVMLPDDGLAYDWHQAPGLVFVNPPYSALGEWLAMCAQEAARGAKVVALVPARTDTRAFHEHVFPGARILFVRGRLRFAVPVEDLEAKHAKKPSARLAKQIAACVDGVCHETDSAPFPTVLVHWNAPEIEERFAHLGEWMSP